MRHFFPVLAGDSERFRRYGPGLFSRGVRFDVVTSRNDAGYANRESLGVGMEVYRTESVNTVTNQFDDRVLFEGAHRLMKSGAIVAPIVQCTLASTPILPQLWRFRREGRKLIHVCTMVGMQDPEKRILGKIKDRARHVWCMLPFHQLVVSSTQMSRWSQSLGAGSRRIEVITNGVDVLRFRPAQGEAEKHEIRSSLHILPGKLVVLFVGNIIPRKGLDLLIRAWPAVLKSHSGACLLIAGPTNRPTAIHQDERDLLASYQREITEMAARLPEGSIKFLGERKDVERLYRVADVFVLPSEQEGMGNVVLEAFASGVPCLLTDFVGLPREEFGTPERHFICVPRRADALEKALLRMARSPEALRAMGDVAREWALQHLSLDRTLDKYASIYKGLMRLP